MAITEKPPSELAPGAQAHHEVQLVELPKGLIDFDLFERRSLSGRRTIYRCPRCRQRAESDTKFSAICAPCEAPFQPVGHR